MDYTQELTLDLNSNNPYPVISAKQGDTARYILVHLTKNNIPYDIDNTHSFYFRMRKPDGYGIINPVQVVTREQTRSAVLSDIMIQLTAQTLAVAGRGYADLVEYDSDNNVLSSISFIVNIMAAPSVVDRAISSDEFQQLAELVADADSVIHDSEAWARGTKGNAPVEPGYTEDNNVTQENFNAKKQYLYIYINGQYISAAASSFDSSITYYGEAASKENNSKYYAEEARNYKDYLAKSTATASLSSIAAVSVSTSQDKFVFNFGIPYATVSTNAVPASDTLPAGTQVTFACTTLGGSQTTDFVVYNGEKGEVGNSGVAISSSSSSFDSNINVWIDTSQSATGCELTANYIVYNSESSYDQDTIGYALKNLGNVVEIASGAQENASAALEAATSALNIANNGIINPSYSTLGSPAILLSTYDTSTSKWIESWNTRISSNFIDSYPINKVENAPRIKQNDSFIPLSGDGKPSEFGLAPANPDSSDGSYYSLPNSKIPESDLSDQIKNKLNNTYISEIQVNGETAKSTIVKILSVPSDLNNVTIDSNVFCEKVNYVQGDYSLEYRGVENTTTLWDVKLNGTKILDSIPKAELGLSYDNDAVSLGDVINVRYKPTLYLENIMTEILITNKNYIDNSWFTVNQRKKEEYTGEDIEFNKYLCDRWKFGYQPDNRRTISITSSGLSIDAVTSDEGIQSDTPGISINQIIDSDTWDSLSGREITISILYNNSQIGNDYILAHTNSTDLNPIICPSKNDSNKMISLNLEENWTCSLKKVNNQLIFDISSSISSNSILVHAVKIELGNVSTLELDIPPIYNEELKKCQRYYVQYNAPANNEEPLVIGMGYTNAQTSLMWEIPLNIQMVGKPTVLVADASSTAVLFNCVGATTTSMNNSVFANSSFFKTTGNSLIVQTTVVGYTSLREYMIQLPAVSSEATDIPWFGFSAEPTEILLTVEAGS